MKEYRQLLSLVMSNEDLIHVRNYFAKEEKRNPTITEIKVLDTYWSDYCRIAGILLLKQNYRGLLFQKEK
ncbi:MAG: hypothetical protein ACRCR9_04670 [Chitinophagaceae bacterium]